MDDEEIQLKTGLKKVDELVALRTSIMYIVVVIFGGTVGLIFAKKFDFFGVILICLGWFYFFLFISNIISINERIDRILFLKKRILFEIKN